MHIFNTNGSVSVVSVAGGENAKIFFSLTKNAETGQSYTDKTTTPGQGKQTEKEALYGNLPVSGLTIDQAVDHSIAKTLNKDFVISEFGDTPVQIGLNGVSFYGDCDGGTDGWGNDKEQILDFYEKNKLSANPKARLKLSITPGKTESGTFVCVLTKMRAVGPLLDKSGSVPVYSYNITLIGVKQ